MEFEPLARKHQDAVYAQMVRVCGNREDAEDTLIEALLAAHRALPSLRDEQAFRGWLAKIARRVCYRIQDRSVLTPLLEEVDPRPTPDREAEAAEMKQCLRDALLALPEDLRQVYVAREVEGLSGEETAKLLGVSLAAMKSRLHRAREALRKNLEKSICADESFLK